MCRCLSVARQRALSGSGVAEILEHMLTPTAVGVASAEGRAVLRSRLISAAAVVLDTTRVLSIVERAALDRRKTHAEEAGVDCSAQQSLIGI